MCSFAPLMAPEFDAETDLYNCAHHRSLSYHSECRFDLSMLRQRRSQVEGPQSPQSNRFFVADFARLLLDVCCLEQSNCTRHFCYIDGNADLFGWSAG